MQWGAVNLFVTRARESAPQFSMDADIATKVTGYAVDSTEFRWRWNSRQDVPPH
jgi:hypothetical protein